MNRKGFTLVEFLIGMAMTVLVFMVATNLVISFLSVNTKSKRSQDVEQVKSDLTRELTNALTWGSTISFSSNMLTVDDVSYELTGKTLYRNKIALTPADVAVDSFLVKKFENGPGSLSPSFEVDINLSSLNSSDIKDNVLVFSSSRTTNANP